MYYLCSVAQISLVLLYTPQRANENILSVVSGGWNLDHTHTRFISGHSWICNTFDFLNYSSRNQSAVLLYVYPVQVARAETLNCTSVTDRAQHSTALRFSVLIRTAAAPRGVHYTPHSVAEYNIPCWLADSSHVLSTKYRVLHVGNFIYGNVGKCFILLSIFLRAVFLNIVHNYFCVWQIISMAEIGLFLF